MISFDSILEIEESDICTEPFNHIVIDDFFSEPFAEKLAEQFPSYENDLWYKYDSPLEVKRAMNSWDKFPAETFQAFWILCQPKFAYLLSRKFNTQLHADVGLNGGGWHMHGHGGKLNIHQDYSIHPKMNMQRKLNIIIYLSPEWDWTWNGGLEFWSHDEKENRPKELVKTIDVRFNRAVIFDTTQNSWHGFPQPIMCPEGTYRKSIAVYYVKNPDVGANPRTRALYAPTKDQENDPNVLRLIEMRKGINR